MHVRLGFVTALAVVLWGAQPSAQRRLSAHPNLQGFWTNGTATPLQRPPEFAGKAFLTEQEAADFERTAIERLVKSFPQEDRNAADLNEIYLETHTLKLADGRRTSLIVDPADGRLPPLLEQAKQRAAARPKRSFDDPETMNLDERCLLETAYGSSNAAPPMVPNPFGQNFYQIVQTPSHVMIFTEVVHDARIIRMNAKHLPPSVQQWLGDSVGHWRATRSSSTRRTSPGKANSEDPANGCTSSNASRARTRPRSATV